MKKYIFYLVLCFTFIFATNCFAYTHQNYIIDLPERFSIINENSNYVVFDDKFDTMITISQSDITKFIPDATSSEYIFHKDDLDKVSVSLKHAIINQMSEQFNMGIFHYTNLNENNNLDSILSNLKSEILSKEYVNISSNEYPSFNSLIKIYSDDFSTARYFSANLLSTKQGTYFIVFSSNSLNYIQSDTLKEIVNSFTISSDIPSVEAPKPAPVDEVIPTKSAPLISLNIFSIMFIILIITGAGLGFIIFRLLKTSPDILEDVKDIAHRNLEDSPNRIISDEIENTNTETKE